jgi:hypothetical protein
MNLYFDKDIFAILEKPEPDKCRFASLPENLQELKMRFLFGK